MKSPFKSRQAGKIISAKIATCGWMPAAGWRFGSSSSTTYPATPSNG
jgi:hypothetical protein